MNSTTKQDFETVLVLQGGGSLGAYECGVYKTLHKHKIKFDIVAGTSIGAINAAIIAGSKNDEPAVDLENFWLTLAETVTPSFLDDEARVVGHDIGLMVAYAYAAQFPTEVEKLVVMDAFLPGIEGWEAVYNNPGIWHFRFNGPTSERLVAERERTYFEYYLNDFAADKTHSIPEADRSAYTAAYSKPGRMSAGWAYFASFQKAAKDFAKLSQDKITVPVLVIGGEKSLGQVLGEQMKLVASDVTVVVMKDTGHWVLEERPKETIDTLMKFL